MRKKSIPRTSKIEITDDIRKAYEERDRQYDNTDVAPLPPEKWANAVVGKYYRPLKEQIALRIDADVLAWFKSKGAGYQSRMNEVLRREMLADSKR
jgi:uncharacterized protein (DUF4415 family)